MLRFLYSSTGCSRMKGTSWPTRNRLMLPDVGKFPYPQDAMPMFVLQVATAEGSWRSCEGAVFSLTSLLHPQHFFLPSFSFRNSSSLSYKRLDTRVKPLLVLLILGVWRDVSSSTQVAPQLVAHELTGKENPQSITNSTNIETSHNPFLTSSFVVYTLFKCIFTVHGLFSVISKHFF